MSNKKHVQQIINMVAFTICICIVVFGIKLMNDIELSRVNLETNIEKEWRLQAKRTLSDVANGFNYDMQQGLVDPNDEVSLQQWAKRNIAGILNGGQTGDAFMINLSDEKFIWDGSPDCAKPEFIINGRFMSDEAEMHQDKEQAEYILDKMRLARSTLDTYDDNWWNFDGSKEYLEWVVIPPGILGFDNESKTNGGVLNNKYSKVLIALGTQKDEVESIYVNDLKMMDKTIISLRLFIIICAVVCISNMIIYVYLNKKKKV